MIRKPFVALCASACLAACGGSGSEQVAGINGGGAPYGGVTVGTVTGFGSVFVNGIEFDTRNSTITLDGNAGTESQLRIGQVVEVRGTLDSNGTTGTASSISFDNIVEGPVQSVDLANGTFSVFGHVVRVTGTTVFDERFADPSIAGVTVGQVAEVSGFRNSSNEVIATRIEPRTVQGQFELSGVVSALDAGAQTLLIGPTLVAFNAAAISNGNIANGACVEINGASADGATLTATSVRVKPCTPNVASNDVGKIEGIVTRFMSTTDFDLNGQPVITDANTAYKDGTAADLALNRRIEVEGTFNADRVLVARKIRFEPDISARLTGTVDSIDATHRTFSIFGVTIATTDTAIYDDRSSAHVRTFNFSDLRTGDYLEVRGTEGPTSSTASATSIVRRNLNARRELHAIARNVELPTFTLLGVTVATSAATNFHGLTQAQFFQQASGRGVRVHGSFNGSSFTATDAVFEELD